MGTHYDGRPAETRALDAYIKLTRATSSVGARLSRQSRRGDGERDDEKGVRDQLRHLILQGQGVR